MSLDINCINIVTKRRQKALSEITDFFEVSNEARQYVLEQNRDMDMELNKLSALSYSELAQLQHEINEYVFHPEKMPNRPWCLLRNLLTNLNHGPEKSTLLKYNMDCIKQDQKYLKYFKPSERVIKAFKFNLTGPPGHNNTCNYELILEISNYGALLFYKLPTTWDDLQGKSLNQYIYFDPGIDFEIDTLLISLDLTISSSINTVLPSRGDVIKTFINPGEYIEILWLKLLNTIDIIRKLATPSPPK